MIDFRLDMRHLSSMCLASGLLAGMSAVFAAEPLRASADISSCSEVPISGTATLTEEVSGEGVKAVQVSLEVQGFDPFSRHAVHIHETAACDPCSAAQGHFDPGPNSNTNPDGNHPYHAGDLINLDVDEDGNGWLQTTTSRVTLSPGPLGVFDGDGSAFIVHVNSDSYCPDGVVAGCAGGARAACGIIRPSAASQCLRQEALKIKKDQIEMKLVNVFNDTITLDGYQLTWPDELGDLIEIKLGGKKVFSGRRSPPTTSFDAGDFAGELKDRQIDTDKEEKLSLKFADESEQATLADFASILTVAENCLATVSP